MVEDNQTFVDLLIPHERRLIFAEELSFYGLGFVCFLSGGHLRNERLLLLVGNLLHLLFISEVSDNLVRNLIHRFDVREIYVINTSSKHMPVLQVVHNLFNDSLFAKTCIAVKVNKLFALVVRVG